MTDRTEPLTTVLRDGFRLIGRFVRGHPWGFVLAVTGAAAFAAAIVASAVVIGNVADQLIIPVLDGGERVGGRWRGAALAVVAVATWKGAGIVLRRTSAHWLQARTQADVRYRLIDHQLRLKLSWFSRRSTGDLMAVSETDARQGTGILAPLPFGTGAALLLVATVVIITIIDVWLGAVTLAALAVTLAVDLHGSWRLFGDFQGLQQTRGVVSGIAHESFDGALTVKALGREELEAARMERSSVRLRDQIVELTRVWAFYRAVAEALPTITIIAMLVIGSLRIRSGAITPGDLVTVVYLLSLLSLPIRLIGYVLWDLAYSLAAWRRVEAVLDVDEFVEHGNERAVADGSGAGVQGAEVGFSYRPEEVVLEGVQWDIPAGRTVAVVGPTGSGKSSLVMLLARLWDPSSGDIRLDGRDLRSFARSELPREVAFVAQEAFLFDDDVHGNITLGMGLSHNEVEEAAALAAAGFIHELPQGFGTPIGERGTSLSGGQRQRVAIARALARKPRLLILDDATSAVDPSVETAILRGLKRAELPSTVVIVAHRRSSIVLADEVVFLDGGRIVAHGSHDELLATEPGYARLLEAYDADAQLRAAEGEGVPA